MAPSMGDTFTKPIEVRTDPYIIDPASVYMARQDDWGYVVTILVVALPNLVDFTNVGIFLV